MLLRQSTANRNARSARLLVGSTSSSTTNVHRAPISRSSVRANVPASSWRRRYWAIRWTIRAYQVWTSPLVGGAVAQETSRCNSVFTRRPNQASSGFCRSASPRARRIKWARHVCRPWSQWWYTPYPSLTKIPAQRSTRASKAALLRLACTLNKATVGLTITHSHASTPC
jgi:hypothetical protein